ncbi:hypothetical protein AE1304_40690 [Aeromonas enteropelogenes]
MLGKFSWKIDARSIADDRGCPSDPSAFAGQYRSQLQLEDYPVLAGTLGLIERHVRSSQKMSDLDIRRGGD